MPNYQNGKIYCIRSHQTDNIYIGSTTQLLCKRFSDHKRRIGNKKIGTTADSILIYDDCYIELIKNFPCNTRKELLAEEGKYIRKTENCINKMMKFESRKEYGKYYRSKHKDKLNNYNKEYQKKNKKTIRKQQKTYITCECGFLIQRTSIARHKRSERHKKLIQGKSIRKKKTYICDCGSEVSFYGRDRHLKIKKHKTIMD